MEIRRLALSLAELSWMHVQYANELDGKPAIEQPKKKIMKHHNEKNTAYGHKD